MMNPIPDPRAMLPSLSTILFAFKAASTVGKAILTVPVPLAEVFVRRDFGAARLGHFSWLNAIVLLLVGWLLVGIVALFHPRQAPSFWTLVFLIAAAALSVWHECTVHRWRSRHGALIAAEPPVTYEGVPWIAWLLRRPSLAAPSMLVIEPVLFAFLLPFLLGGCDPVLAGLCKWLGVCLFVAGLRAFSERHRCGESVAEWAAEVMRARGRIP